ncbi:MAG TPA: class II aldolase/adducin family protein [Mesotoga infera]|jgi:L-fuculose-phosphate aldolase|nr:class II aldolase/adducin family protein [Mesotoga sp.]HON29090.1 class II aldolase/adducin family protein [Mesotoga infera]HPD39128.1 class II aldolase/adducin family protein [Mesotoga infera]HRR45210.1 class II aldolase/adducin family protein [Mesotoga sp.]HRV02683.1 class II aldolase/adducin family protein [Mesotoga sp.]
MNREDFAGLVLDACRRMEERGMTVGTWGNISVRIDSESFLITPSGMSYGCLKTEDIVLADMKGFVIDSKRKPSIEHGLHRMIYKYRPDVGAVIHTHPQYSTAFAIARKDVPAVSEELVQIIGEGVKCAKYALPGTEELAINAVEALGNNNAVLLANHGAVCVGSTLGDAFKVAEVLEKSAKTIIMATIIGTPQVISHEECLKMQDFVRNHYGQK